MNPSASVRAPAATIPATGPARRCPRRYAIAIANRPPARAMTSQASGAPASPSTANGVVNSTGNGFHDGPVVVTRSPCRTSRPQISQAHGSYVGTDGNTSEAMPSARQASDEQAPWARPRGSRRRATSGAGRRRSSIRGRAGAEVDGIGRIGGVEVARTTGGRAFPVCGGCTPQCHPDDRRARRAGGDTCRTDGRVMTSRGKHGPVNTSHPHPTDVVVIGAGPAGLTAALRLAERGVLPVIVEGDDVVGGISRTVVRDDWRFDIGGHRFFTKVPEVEELWNDLLPGDELMRPPPPEPHLLRRQVLRLPAQPVERAVQPRRRRVDPLPRCPTCGRTCGRARDEDNFESWVSSRFGRRLYRMFFKTYTEKVWGMPADEMPADWAAQRIKSLSLGGAVRNAVGWRADGGQVTSLIEEFQYPQLGPGMMWEACRDRVIDLGATLHFDSPVARVDALRRPSHRRSRSPTATRVRRRRRGVVDAVRRADPGDGPAAARGGRPGGQVAAPPRLPHRRARRPRGGRVPGQLDLRPLAGRPPRPGAELRFVVAVDGASRHDVPRARVLRQRGRRGVVDVRRGAGRVRRRRAEHHRAARPVGGRARLRRAGAEGVPGLRQRLPGQHRHDAGLARGARRRTSTRSGATGCTATTTRTTRC